MEEKGIDLKNLTSEDILEYIELLKTKAKQCQKKFKYLMEQQSDIEALLEAIIRTNIEVVIFKCKKELIERNIDF